MSALLPAPSRPLETATPRRPTVANATLLGVGPIRDLERAIARPSQPLAKGSAPHIPEAEDHWQSFEDLGLPPPPSSVTRVVRRAGPPYRLLGFSILTLIAVVIAGYIVTTVFYYLSTSWIAPVRVSAADDRVVALRSELATQQARRDRLAGELALEKKQQAREALRASLAHQDEIVAALTQSPYLRALAGSAALAFVPYGNGAATPGAPVYACRAAMVLCRQVGTVAGVLPGEVTSRHPRRDRVVRGQMVELALAAGERDAAEQDVLFVGGKPLRL